MAHHRLKYRVLYLAMLLGGVASQLVLPAWAAGVTPGAATEPTGTAVMLANDWRDTLNPADFWVSEKLDGVRALWDGQTLRFRSGRVIAAPGWFTAALPATALDGELWMGRGSFDRLSGAVRKTSPVDAEWREVRYMIFDTPGVPGNFGQRMQGIASSIQAVGVPWLQSIAQQRMADSAALQRELRNTVNAGGEGLVLHHALALWQTGRSDGVRKLKLQPDEEGSVVALKPGKGRHIGRMGALVVEMADGQQFALGTGFSDAEREAPPKLGSIVTYRYRGKTPAGLPKFASFLRVRALE
jgi:DNA ligase-1